MVGFLFFLILHSVRSTRPVPSADVAVVAPQPAESSGVASWSPRVGDKYIPTVVPFATIRAVHSGHGGSWSSSAVADSCTFVLGYDQPAAYDLPEWPKKLDAAGDCCDACRGHQECRSWVWHEGSLSCHLKRTYNAAENIIPCHDCVSYEQDGAYALLRPSSTESFNPVDTPSVPLLLAYDAVRKSSSIEEDATDPECSMTHGFDQPSMYDVLDGPVRAVDASECCNACSRQKDICRSWVFKTKTSACYLKDAYDAGQDIPCDDCIAYRKFDS